MGLTPFVPNGAVKVLRGVGLDNSYSDTFTFVSKTQQQLFFESKLAYTMTEATPVRQPGVIRFHANATSIYDCDYLMFQNTNYNNKWFYAFITNIEWVNVNMCDISYEIDIVQTWYFEFVYPEMFIEREHVGDDTIGANLIDENLETGELIYRNVYTSGVFDDYVYCVWTTVDNNGETVDGTTYGGIYSGLNCQVFTSAAAINSYLSWLTSHGKADAVVSINMAPTEFKPTPGGGSPTIITRAVAPQYSDIDGYIPRNNKLFTFPYNFLKVTNHEGNAGSFRWEFFKNITATGATAKFNIFMDETPSPTATCVPLGYKGYDQNVFGDADEQITITSFPLCAWTTDTYKAWLAQNSNTFNWQMENTVVNGAIGVGMSLANLNLAGVVSTGLRTYMGIQQLMAADKDHSLLPPQAHGSNSGYTQVALNMQGFYFCNMTITKEYAKSIDAFFSMYGYAVHQIKPPNIVGRQCWNYVKTQGAIVLGNAPATAAKQMADILDQGIRFWHGDYLGQFFRSNPITSTLAENTSMINGAGETVSEIALERMMRSGPRG